MRACILHAIGDLRCEEWPDPKLPRGSALVRIHATGVCGSDLPRVFEKGTYSFPLIPGHEMSGAVVEAPAADWLQPGAPVVVFPLIPRRGDPYVAAGLPQLAEGYDYLGSRSDGGFAELVAAPVSNLVPVPPNVDLDVAALTEPSAVALHAVRRGGVGVGDRVWVVGAGPIGMILCQWARIAGAERVLVSDIDPTKLEVVARNGWAEVCDPSEHEPVAWVTDATEGWGADVVIEAVGVEATVRQAVRGCRKRGAVVLMGNPAADVRLPQADYWEILRRELHLVGTWNSSRGVFPLDEWGTALEAMAEGRLRLEELITHRVSLEETPALMRRMHDRAESYIKVLVKP